MKRIILAILFVFLSPAFSKAQTVVSPFVSAHVQFLDSNGAPLAGGFVFTYISGTNTPQATYTDYTGGTLNPNPVVLDASGSANIWLTSGALYRITVQNSVSVQQWTSDGIANQSALIAAGTYFSLPFYTNAGINSILGPSQITTDASLMNLFVPGFLSVGNPSLPGEITGVLQSSGCVAPGSGKITLFLGDSVTNDALLGIGTNPCVPIALLNAPTTLTAAGINTVDATLGASPGIITVNIPGSYCDTQILLSANHVLQFGAGTYFINIAGADSTTANVTWGVVGQGSNQTVIKSCPSTNLDVITSQNFASFTGGSNFYGVYHPIIRNLTIDGNKANETAGFGIRLYGRSVTLEGAVFVQNAYQDGVYAEWGGSANFSAGPGTQVNGNADILESDFNGGNGFTFKGITGAINAINTLVAMKNGGWGFQTGSSLQINNINTFLNPSGGCDVQSGGDLIASNANCNTGATGWGLLQESGVVQIHGGTLAGGIPLEVRAGAQTIISAAIENSGTGDPCLNVNGGQDMIINASFFSCTTVTVAFTSDGGGNIINGQDSSIDTLTSGTISTSDTINLRNAAATTYIQVPNKPFNVNTFAFSYPSIAGQIVVGINSPGAALNSAFTSITAGTCQEQAITITGAMTTETASVSPVGSLGTGFSWSAWIPSSGTVNVRVCSGTTGTPASLTWNVTVYQ